MVYGDGEPGDRHAREPEPAGCDETLVAADDGLIVAASEHRLDEPELAQAALKRVELVLADPPRVGGIGPEVVERDELDRERSRHGDCSLPSGAASGYDRYPPINLSLI